jgi:hypothetical protein
MATDIPHRCSRCGVTAAGDDLTLHRARWIIDVAGERVCPDCVSAAEHRFVFGGVCPRCNTAFHEGTGDVTVAVGDGEVVCRGCATLAERRADVQAFVEFADFAQDFAESYGSVQSSYLAARRLEAQRLVIELDAVMALDAERLAS